MRTALKLSSPYESKSISYRTRSASTDFNSNMAKENRRKWKKCQTQKDRNPIDIILEKKKSKRSSKHLVRDDSIEPVPEVSEEFEVRKSIRKFNFFQHFLTFRVSMTTNLLDGAGSP